MGLFSDDGSSYLVNGHGRKDELGRGGAYARYADQLHEHSAFHLCGKTVECMGVFLYDEVCVNGGSLLSLQSRVSAQRDVHMKAYPIDFQGDKGRGTVGDFSF
ncbi:MAG: hypothetical protein IPH31_15875 [Lewinellaceae bacterium]|nr:hypothetical protein [Lewinellaceae bacterium]